MKGEGYSWDFLSNYIDGTGLSWPIAGTGAYTGYRGHMSRCPKETSSCQKFPVGYSEADLVALHTWYPQGFGEDLAANVGNSWTSLGLLSIVSWRLLLIHCRSKSVLEGWQAYTEWGRIWRREIWIHQYTHGISQRRKPLRGKMLIYKRKLNCY